MTVIRLEKLRDQRASIGPPLEEVPFSLPTIKTSRQVKQEESGENEKTEVGGVGKGRALQVALYHAVLTLMIVVFIIVLYDDRKSERGG